MTLPLTTSWMRMDFEFGTSVSNWFTVPAGSVL